MENNPLASDPQLRFIGCVRSDIKDRKQMPVFGAPAIVELDPAMAPGLLQIGKHSHMWVLAWLMGRSERDVLQVIPRGVDRDRQDAIHGVFAVRSPARPNPIGLTAAKVERIDGLRIHFDSLDFLDGTPVLDLKPYFVARDLIFSARNVTIGKPRNKEARRESLLLQALRFVPVLHADVALAVRIIEHYSENYNEEIVSLSVPLAHPHLVDALIGITRLSLSNGLRLTNDQIMEVNESKYEIPQFTSYDAIMQASDSDLFSAP